MTWQSSWEMNSVEAPRGATLPLLGRRMPAPVPKRTRPSRRSLHGAAGLGLALLELYAAIGRPDFLDAARRAFEYEDSLFDPDPGNWRVLRPDVPPPGFTCTWCYGAAGIALSGSAPSRSIRITRNDILQPAGLPSPRP